MAQSPDSRPDANGMPVLEHVGELRRRIIYCLIVFVLGLVGGLFGARPLFDYLVQAAPVDNLTLHVFSPWDSIGLYMKFAILISFIAAIPFTLYQLWAFVRPALGAKEQRSALKFVPGALIMFLIGLTFAYFVVFPMAYLFTEQVTSSLGLEQTYRVTDYFAFLFNILLPVSLLFELPLIILFLTGIGILNPTLLQKMRKIAWFALIAIATMITPPDVISDILVSVPLVLLYEFSVLLSRIAYRKRIEAREKKEAELAAEDNV